MNSLRQNTRLDPESLTIAHITAALKPKHWSTIIGVIFTVLAGTAGGAYWVGQQLAGVESGKAIAKLETELKLVQTKLGETSSQNAQWANAYGELRGAFDRQSNELLQQAQRAGQANSCEFMRRNIAHTQTHIDVIHLNRYGNPLSEAERVQVAGLEDRLARYQQQLGSCQR